MVSRLVRAKSPVLPGHTCGHVLAQFIKLTAGGLGELVRLTDIGRLHAAGASPAVQGLD